MVALIVAMSIMAILMSVAMPTWKQMAQREKEAELIFRGQQYARAIGLFQKKSGPGVLPPNIDALVEGHYLRQKYKDPMTGGDFEVLQAGAPGAATPGGSTANPTPQPAAAGRGATATSPQGGPGQAAGMGRGGVMGVASKSKEASIRIYNGRTHYNEWQFVYVMQTQGPGQGGPGGAQRGGQPQRGGQNQGPGGAGVGGGRDGGRGRGGPFGGTQGTGQPPPFGRGGFPGGGGFPPPSPGRR